MHTATAVPSLSKVALRRDALEARRAFASALSPRLRGELEQRLTQRLLPHLGTATAIAAYHPMSVEIDTAPVVAALLAAGRTVALPWFADRDARMIFREEPAAVTGPWAVRQPDAASVAVRPDIILVPLVAADVACNRIGHSKGHYDRALSHMREIGPVRAIGLAWDMQILEDIIPADPWDVPLDAIATPDRWLERPQP